MLQLCWSKTTTSLGVLQIPVVLLPLDVGCAAPTVEQFDTLVDNLSVYEMLLYTAEMKLPISVSIAKKRDHVDHLVNYLGLDSCKHTRIGSQLKRGISGGQVGWDPCLLPAACCLHVLFICMYGA